MHVIGLVSQKGGVGKTTLTAHLAVEAGREGDRVAIIDLDPQGSLTGWYNRRQHSTEPAMKATTPEALENLLDDHRRQGIGVVLIDTPGRNTPAITRIVPHLNLALVPARPSPMDLEASIPTLDAIEQLGRRAVFVVNGASTSNTAITGDIRRELSALGVVAPTTVHNRDDFVRPMIRGLVAAEARPKGNAALEIGELWKYVASRLRRQERLSAGESFSAQGK